MAKWALIGRGSDIPQENPIFADCERVLLSDKVRPGRFYVVDPDEVRMTDLATGESWTLRERPETA